MPGLLDLSNELLLIICDRLSERAVTRLMRTRRSLYYTLQEYVYQRNIANSNSTSLPFIVQAGGAQSIELVLNIRCQTNLKLLQINRQGNTALLAAISTGNVVAALNLIRRRGRQLNCKNRLTAWRPLTLAVAKSQEDVVQALIDQKVSPGNNHEDSKTHGSPLLLAARYGRYRLVEKLLKLRKLDRGVMDNQLHTALDLAVISGCRLTVQTLLDDPLMENARYGWNPIFHGIKSRNVEIVKILVQGGMSVTPAHMGKALKSGNEAIVLALVPSTDELMRARWKNYRALACAAEGGLIRFVETLLPAACSAERHEALMCAAKKKQWEAANFILEDDQAREAIHIFCRFPDTQFYLQRDCKQAQRMRGARGFLLQTLLSLFRAKFLS
ncbi:hypothetical protein PWT90_08805 [Aphanocladium album]|nr:hypothetical protein PWT90_08805 [Aphanocladium album]